MLPVYTKSRHVPVRGGRPVPRTQKLRRSLMLTCFVAALHTGWTFIYRGGAGFDKVNNLAGQSTRADGRNQKTSGLVGLRSVPLEMVVKPFTLESAYFAAESFLAAFLNSLVVFGLPMVSSQLVLPTFQEYLSEIGVLGAPPQQRLLGAGGDIARTLEDMPHVLEATDIPGRLFYGVFPRIQNNLFLSGACSVAVFLYSMYIVPQGLPALDLPVLPFGISSLIIAAVLVCRAMVGKSRFELARDRWDSVVAMSRDLATKASLSPASREAAIDFARWVPAFSAALMCELREGTDDDLRKELVAAAGLQDSAKGDGQGLSASAIQEIFNRPANLRASEFVLRRLQSKLTSLNLSDLERHAMDQSLAQLVDDLNACDNVSAIPSQFSFPLGFAELSSQFLLLWLVLLPLGLVSQLGAATMVVQPLIGLGLLGLEDIGSQLEAPFLTLPLKRTTVKFAAEAQAMRRMGVAFDKNGPGDFARAGEEWAKAPKLMIDGSGRGGGGGRPVLQGFASEQAPQFGGGLPQPPRGRSQGPKGAPEDDSRRQRAGSIPGLPKGQDKRSPEALASWLRGRNLYKYVGALAAAGYSDMQLLSRVEPDEIERLVNLCQMPRGHARHFSRGLEEVRSQMPDGSGLGGDDSDSSSDAEENSLDLYSRQALQAWLGRRRLARYLEVFVSSGYKNLLLLAQAEPDAIMVLIQVCEMPRGHARHFERGLEALRLRIQRGSALGEDEMESKPGLPEDMFSRQALQSWLRQRRLERYLDDFVNAGYTNLQALAQAEPVDVSGLLQACKMPMGHARHLERGLQELRRRAYNGPALVSKESEPSSEVADVLLEVAVDTAKGEPAFDPNQDSFGDLADVADEAQEVLPARGVDFDVVSQDTMQSWLEERRLSRYLENFISAGYENLSALVNAEPADISDLVNLCKMPRGHARHMKRGLDELRSREKSELRISREKESSSLALESAAEAASDVLISGSRPVEDKVSPASGETSPEGANQPVVAADAFDGSPPAEDIDIADKMDLVSQQGLQSWLESLTLSRYFEDFVVNAGYKNLMTLAAANPAEIQGLIESCRMPHGHARQLLRGLKNLKSSAQVESMPDVDALPQGTSTIMEGTMQITDPEEEPEGGMPAQASPEDEEVSVEVVEAPPEDGDALQDISSGGGGSERQPEVTPFQAAEVLLEVAVRLSEDGSPSNEKQTVQTSSDVEQEPEVDSAGDSDFSSKESLKSWLRERRLARYFDDVVDAGYHNLLDLAKEQPAGIRGLTDSCKMPRGHARHLERGLADLRLRVQSGRSLSGEAEDALQEASGIAVTTPREDDGSKENQAALVPSETLPKSEGSPPEDSSKAQAQPATDEGHRPEESVPAQQIDSSGELGLVSQQAMLSWLEQRDLARFFGDFVSAGYDNLLRLANAAPGEINGLIEQCMLPGEQAQRLESSLEELRLLVRMGLQPTLAEKGPLPPMEEAAEEASSAATAGEHEDSRSGDEPAPVILSDTEPEMEPEAARDLIESYNALDETRPTQSFSPVDERDWVSQEALRLWLEEHNLERYLRDFLDAGYETLLMLAEASPEEMSGLVESCKMPQGHARHVRRAHEDLCLLAHRQSQRGSSEKDSVAEEIAGAVAPAPREDKRPSEAVDLFSEEALKNWLERHGLALYLDAFKTEGYRNLLILSAAVPDEITYLTSLCQMPSDDAQNLQGGLVELRAQGQLGLGSIEENLLDEEPTQGLQPVAEETKLEEVPPQEEFGMVFAEEDKLAGDSATSSDTTSLDELSAWLRSHRLDRYADSFAQQGYCSLSSLSKAAPEDISALIKVCGMPLGHARHLKRCLRDFSGPLHEAQATSVAAAAAQESQQGHSTGSQLNMLSEDTFLSWLTQHELSGYVEALAEKGVWNLQALSEVDPQYLSALTELLEMPPWSASLLERGAAELRQGQGTTDEEGGRQSADSEAQVATDCEEQPDMLSEEAMHAWFSHRGLAGHSNTFAAEGYRSLLILSVAVPAEIDYLVTLCGMTSEDAETLARSLAELRLRDPSDLQLSGSEESLLTGKLAELEEQGQHYADADTSQEAADLTTCELSSIEDADDILLSDEQLAESVSLGVERPELDWLSETALRSWLRDRKLGRYADGLVEQGFTSLLALSEAAPAEVAGTCDMPKGHARHLRRSLSELSQLLRATALQAAATHKSSEADSTMELEAIEELDESTRQLEETADLISLELGESMRDSQLAPPQEVALSAKDGTMAAEQAEEDLESWLERRGLSAYLDTFRAEGYKSLLILSAAVPEEIGYLISSCGMPSEAAQNLQRGLAELRTDEQFGLDSLEEQEQSDKASVQEALDARLILQRRGWLHADELDGLSRDALSSWLRSRGLERYESSLVDQGYENLEILVEAQPEEIADLIEASGMPKGHARHFERGLADLRLELEGAMRLSEEAEEPQVLDLSLPLERLKAGLLSGWKQSDMPDKLPALMLGGGRDGGGGTTLVCFDDGSSHGPRSTGLQLIKLKKGTGEQGNDSGISESLIEAAVPWFGDPILSGTDGLESSRRGLGYRRLDTNGSSSQSKPPPPETQLPQEFESVFTPEQTPAPRSRERSQSYSGQPDYFDISEGNEDDYHEQAFRAWIHARKLSKYLDIFLYEGYGDLQVLREMEPDEISDLIELCNMPPGHARHFERGLDRLRGQPQGSSSSTAARVPPVGRSRRRVVKEEIHTQEGLRSWLRRRKLVMYAEGIVEAGYTNLAGLCGASQEEIRLLTKKSGMSLGHAWHFVRGLGQVRPQVPTLQQPPASEEIGEPLGSPAAAGSAEAAPRQPEPLAVGARDAGEVRLEADVRLEAALRLWLRERKLAQYFGTFVREGYSNLQVLRDAEPDEISDLIELCRMPSGHTRHFERGLTQLRHQGPGVPWWSASSGDSDALNTPRREGTLQRARHLKRQKTEEEADFQEAVGSWLYRRKLSKYLETFVREGYSNLRILKEACPDEISDLIGLCGMPPGHAQHFQRGLERLRARAGPVTSPAHLGTAVGTVGFSDSDEDAHPVRLEETLGDWLRSRRLSMYQSDLTDRGITSLALLRDLSQGMLDDLIVSCGMKLGHAHHFARGLHQLRNPSQDMPWLVESARTECSESQDHMSTSAGEEDPNAREELRLWLQCRKLLRYFDAFVDKGYGSLVALRDSSPSAIRSLAKACGMPPGHIKHLERGLQRLRSEEDGLFLAREAARELARRSSVSRKELELVGA